MICVYLAGPITKPNPHENAVMAIPIADKLLSLGYAPFVSQLSVFWQEYGTISANDKYGEGYELFMKMDFEWISRCDCLLRIPGYSLGADREVDFAKSRNIPVFLSVEELHSSVVVKVSEVISRNRFL